MQVFTSKLSGVALDWAVAKVCGHEWWAAENPKDGLFFDKERTRRYSPSSDWAIAGPVIEHERITLRVSTMAGTEWAAFYDVPGEYHAHVRERGPTALVAAMRCLVAKHLGKMVEVPDELCTEGEHEGT
jgi:hypothetical protein